MNTGILLYILHNIQYNKYKQTKGELEKKTLWTQNDLHSSQIYNAAWTNGEEKKNPASQFGK